MISDFHSWRSLGGILCSLLWFKFISDLNCRFQILNRVIFQIKISKKIPDRYSILKYFKVFFDKLWNNLYMIYNISYHMIHMLFWYTDIKWSWPPFRSDIGPIKNVRTRYVHQYPEDGDLCWWPLRVISSYILIF